MTLTTATKILAHLAQDETVREQLRVMRVAGERLFERVKVARTENGACPTCHDDGEIEVNPSRVGDPQEARPAPCPDCRGEDVPPHENDIGGWPGMYDTPEAPR